MTGPRGLELGAPGTYVYADRAVPRPGERGSSA